MTINYPEILIGSLLGWVLTRIGSALTKACLSFEIDNGQIFKQNSNEYKFLSIRVRNKPKSLFHHLLNFLFGRMTLDNAKARIEFMLPCKPHIVIKTINNARWASTKEPVDYSTMKIDLAQILMPSRDSIFPEEEGVINIAIKKNGDVNFYGFNNESYYSQWWPLKPDFEITEKYCHVKLEILSLGKIYSYKFSITNTNKKLEDFLLQTY